MNPPRAIASATVVSIAVVLLIACGGSAPLGASDSSPPAKTTPASPASVACSTGARSLCLTASSGGRTVTVGVGWTVTVELRGHERQWSALSQYGEQILRQLGAVKRQAGSVQAAYEAIAPGRTELRALERPVCLPGRICPQFILLWLLRVDVRSH